MQDVVFFEIEISHKLRKPNADYILNRKSKAVSVWNLDTVLKLRKSPVIWQIFRQTVHDELHDKFLPFRILEKLVK